MRWFAIDNFIGNSARLLCFLSIFTSPIKAEVDVYIADVPDYPWYAGCTGVASGMIMAYWDRHGFPNFYTGPTSDGVAPLRITPNTLGIVSLWATQAGFDGRPTNKLGHQEDYCGNYYIGNTDGFEGTDPDPYILAHRAEHAPECLGDFIGLSQKKWTNMNDECDGNINNYAFVYWDKSGNKRTNYIPPAQGTNLGRDIPSGWIAWTKSRGHEANVFSQLTDFNTTVSGGRGFSFADLKREINAGYPLLFYQQQFTETSRALEDPMPMPRSNPGIHSGVIFGYYEDTDGSQWVRYRSGWGDGADDGGEERNFSLWNGMPTPAFPARGLCGYHPLPKMKNAVRNTNNTVTLSWYGPAGQLWVNGALTNIHYYVVERSYSLAPASFQAITSPSIEHTATVSDPRTNTVFYRVKLLGP